MGDGHEKSGDEEPDFNFFNLHLLDPPIRFWKAGWALRTEFDCAKLLDSDLSSADLESIAQASARRFVQYLEHSGVSGRSMEHLSESWAVWLKSYSDLAKKADLPSDLVWPILRHIYEVTFQLSLAVYNAHAGDHRRRQGALRILQNTVQFMIRSEDEQAKHLLNRVREQAQAEARGEESQIALTDRRLKASSTIRLGYDRLKALLGRRDKETGRVFIAAMLDEYRRIWKAIASGQPPTEPSVSKKDRRVLAVLDYLTRAWELALTPSMYPGNLPRRYSPLGADEMARLWAAGRRGAAGGAQRTADDLVCFSTSSDSRLRAALKGKDRPEPDPTLRHLLDTLPANLFEEVTPVHEVKVGLVDGLPTRHSFLQPDSVFTLAPSKAYRLPVTGPGAWVASHCRSRQSPDGSAREDVRSELASPIWYEDWW